MNFGGDETWDDKTDDVSPLPKGKFDSWLKLHPTQVQKTYHHIVIFMVYLSYLKLTEFLIFSKIFEVE